MYCSECKLRVADDSITVCPVCQGPLQSDAVEEEVFNDAADKGGPAAPEIQVEDKFSAYERPDQELDFNPEKLGLESSVQKDPADEDEDIQALTDLWGEEEIDADLEGVLAEAFSLDETNDDIKAKDGLGQEDVDTDLEAGLAEVFSPDEVNDDIKEKDDLNQEEVFVEAFCIDEVNDDVEAKGGPGQEDTDADLEGALAEAFSLDEVDDDIEAKDDLNQEDDDLDLGEALKIGEPEVLPAQPPVVPPSQSRGLWLLLLLIFVVGAGGGIWFYSQKSKSTSGERVVRSVPQTQPLKPAPLPPVKETVAAEKTATVEPVAATGGNAVDDKTGKLVTSVPVQPKTLVEVTDLKDEGIKASALEAVVDPATAAVSEELKTSETLVASLAVVAEEKEPVPGKVLTESGVKTVAETKPQVSPPDSVSQEKVGRKSPKIVKAAVVDKAEVSLTSPYAIHIGSFKSQKSVSRQLAMLQEKGFAAYQVEVDLKNKGVWQRVMVPGGTTRKEAKVVQKKLTELFPREDSRILEIKK